MSKKEIIKNIEDGLLNFYVQKDDHIYQQAMAEEGINMDEISQEYDIMAKQILFKARVTLNERRITKVISIIEKSKVTRSTEEDKAKIISIFNRHVHEYGLAVNYRNLEEMDVEEIKEILNQIDLTALINELMIQDQNE